MVIHPLTQAECVEVLSRVNIGRLACARDGQPYIVPISLYFDGTAGLYSVSTVGQKIDWMRQNPKVCVEVEDISDRFHWTTVVITGTYEELSDAGATVGDELRRAFGLLQQRSQWWLPATAQMIERDHSTVVVFRVRINAVSGRRTAQPHEKR